MKLPTLKSSTVTRLETPSAAVAAAPMQAISEGIGAVAEAVGEYQAKQHHDEVIRESVTSESTARERQIDLHRAYSDAFIPEGDERLADLEYNEADIEIDGDGNRFVRTTAILPQAIERGNKKIGDEIQSTLATDEAKLSFTEFYSELALRSNEIAFNQQQKNQKAADLVIYLETYNEQLIRGDFVGAQKTIDAARITGTISEETYFKQSYSLKVNAEEIEINEIGDSADAEAMYAEADRLRDKDYKGALPYPRRQEAADELDAKAYKLEQAEITAGTKAEVAAIDGLLLQDPDSLTQADVRQMESVAAYLRSDDYEGDITDPDKRLQKAEELESLAATSNLSQAAQQEREEGREVGNLELGVRDPNGNTTTTQVEDAFNDGLIDDSKRTQLLDGIRKRDEDKQTRAATAAAIEYAAKNNIPIDPGNKDVRAAIDSLYEKRVSEGQSPEAAGLDIMRTYKIMPEGIKAIFRGANRSDAGGLVEAAKLYTAGVVTAPQSMKDVTPDSVAIVAAVSANMRLGMDDAEAVASVQAWEAMPDTRQEAVKTAVRLGTDDGRIKFKDMINDYEQYNVPWTTAEIEPTMTMDIEFSRLTEKYLSVTGDMAAAQVMAFDKITSSWQLTNINGDYQYMKFAPQGDSEQIRQDLENTYGPNVMIQSDPATELQMLDGQKPTYRVYKKQHDPDPLPKEGWKEDFEKQTGMQAIDLNITTRKDADNYMQTQFSVGHYQLPPRYTFDSDKALARETDRLKTEARKAIAERKEFTRAKEKSKQDIVEARARRMATQGIPYKEKEAYLQSEKGRKEFDRHLTNLVASGDIPEWRADKARGVTF